MKIINAEQRSPEWFAARCGIATASNFAKVLSTIKSGESAERRNYRIKLALERITRTVEESYQNEAMRIGIEREPQARIAYEASTGNMADEVGFCLHGELECGASPDGLIDDDGGLEIKCPTPGKHFEYLRASGEPPEYTAQIQGCIWVTGRKWWDFVSYCPDFPDNASLIVRRVHRDDEYISNLANKIAAFMDEVRADVDTIIKYKAA